MAYCLHYATITKHFNLNLIDRNQFPWLTVSIASIYFFKKMGQSRPLFVYFCSFLITISIQIQKSIDSVLGIWTWGRRMVGADETRELWRPLQWFNLKFVFDIGSRIGFMAHLQCDQIRRLLDFGPLFKAFGNNYFVQFSHILKQFLYT